MSGTTIYRPGTATGTPVLIDYFMAGYGPAGDDRLYDAQIRMDKLRGLTCYPKLKALYILAAPSEAAAAVNWINTTKGKLTKTGTLTWTADRGYTGNGTSGLLSSGLTADGLGIAQNSITIGAYINQLGAANAGAIDVALGANAYIVTRNTTNYGRYRANSGTTMEGGSPIPASTTGLWTARRQNATQVGVKYNTAAEFTYTNASAVPSGTFTLMGSLTGAYTYNRVGAGFVADYMSDADISEFYVWLTDLLTSIGAG